ncbi:sensor histidine kinase [Jiella marina]|uniref:sensor histidine kinase n=1 Tax=Jiella sp. LLJ827 TaxID=2917712 RepID=UPI0021019B81|nr:PAS domain S-box protein [Jiella sp. LLJ827]MCQ0989357.1 PAS domain S-box protein [Jiella sp. LLJ827]
MYDRQEKGGKPMAEWETGVPIDREKKVCRQAAMAPDLLDIIGDGVVSTDQSGRILIFNRAAEEIFGFAAEEVLGRPVEVLMPDRFHAGHIRHVRTLASSASFATRLMGHRRSVMGRRRNGEEFPLEATLSRSVLDGAPILTVVIRDVTERRRQEAELAASRQVLADAERRLRLALEAGSMGVWEWHRATDRLDADPLARRLWGLPETGPLRRADLDHGSAAGLGTAVDRVAEEGGETELELQTTQADGSRRWVLIKGAVFTPDTADAATIVGVTFDVTERATAEEQRRLIIGELDHRMKNLLAMINAIIAMSGSQGMSLPDYKRALLARMGALSQTHNLLVAGHWTGTTLQDLIAGEMGAYGYPEGDRVVVSGPDVPLGPGLGLAMGLALHELATNAAKYGALSASGGRVTMDWSLRAGRGETRLAFEWRESGGPPVEPPTRRGFGSVLIERMMRLRGAEVAIDYAPEGLCCRIDLPVGDVGVRSGET